MFRKVHDRMFRKAQMKLFTMIVSILLAVFFALIVGINLITEAVMEGQSKEVLQEIAADINYDDKRAKFIYKRQDDQNGSMAEQLPSSSAEPVNTAPPTDNTTAAASSTAPPATETPESTDAPTDENTQPAETQPESDPETQPAEPETEPSTWFAYPTFPYEPTVTTLPNNGGQGWYDWSKNEWVSQDGQDWSKKDWNTGGFGFGGSVQSGQNDGNQNQDWNNWNNWNNWNGQNWNGQNGDQQYEDILKGWYWDGSQWKNKDGRVWDGVGMPPWFDGADQADQKTNDWWTNSPYNIWRPDNPYNPMNPYNPYAQKSKEEDYSRYSGDNKVKDSEEKSGTSYTAEEYKSDVSIDPGDGYTLGQTAGGSGTYGIVQLADSGNSAASSMGSYNAQNSKKVETIPKSIGSIDFFVMMADTNGNYLGTINNDEIVDKKGEAYTYAIINDRHESGYVNSYQYYKASKPNGTIMILTDKSYEKNMLMQLKRTTIIVGLIALVILSVLAYFLSKKSIQPIKVAFDKQKQFVSDASHELKTPLTVISTNADVLEGEIGDNKWLKYIKSQTDRMSVLVNDLLNLTRLENSNNELERRYFNLSKAIANTALPFECRAFESNKKFEVNIEDNIMLNGSEKHIKQMAAIFIDNALKYSNDGGTVQVTLKKSGDRKLFSVYNTGDGIKENDTEKIFERFYRSDESRNRATGGYGLGLAIAKTVADKHKFKIHVLNQPGKGVCFIVTM